MIIARAPVRVSFGGGGSDLAAYYEAFGGYVLSAAITRYCHVIARPSADGRCHIISSDFGLSETLDAERVPEATGALGLPRAALAQFWDDGIAAQGVELALTADVPPGTGLGSSSAMAVALMHALSAYCGQALSAERAAQLACALEIERLQMPIGRQDQYASAYGGLNEISFAPGNVQVRPLALPATTMAALDASLLLFATGLRRHSASILGRQAHDSAANPQTIAALHAVKQLARAMHDALLAADLDGFGQLLDAAWCQKRRLSGAISSPEIDRWYAAARAGGALGGKITGAGGGGFLLLCCPPPHQQALRAVMAEHGLRELSFAFEPQGAYAIV